MTERLFVPLSTASFHDFENGKLVEVRKCRGNFTQKFVYPGRRVELRLGYSSNGRLWGNVGRVIVGSLEDIFQQFELANIEPRAADVQQAIAENLEILGRSEKYIGFAIDIDGR